MAITVTALKIDEDGDAGYVLSVQNKTDAMAYVFSEEGWTLGDAKVADPVFQMEVGAGDSVEGFLWFDREELSVDSLDELAKVSGALVAEDHDTLKRIGRYPFKL